MVQLYDEKLYDITINNYDLYSYVFAFADKWISRSLSTEFGIDLSSSKDIRSLMARMLGNSQVFGQYMAVQYGRNFFTKAISQLIAPLHGMFGDRTFQRKTVCLEMFYDVEHAMVDECYK